MDSELLQQVRVLDPVSEKDFLADVLIVDGLIKTVETKITDLPTDTKVRNCQGLILGPGLVDLYSHSGEPGHEERETWLSLLKAGAAGGFTRLAILPDTLPPLDNPSGLARLHQQQLWESETPLPHLYCWGSLTVSVQGQQMTELAELAAAGVVGFADGHPLSTLALMRRLLEYLQLLNKPVALVPCDPQLTDKGVMREGVNSIRLGLPGSPAIAESSAIASILEVVAAVGTPVHLMRISTNRGVELISEAKARGLPVSASTTWMHLLLNTEDLDSYNPSLHLEPPLGNPDDQIALIQGIKEGIIDAIAIDHTPYSYEEKTLPFAEAPPGAIGLELALPLLWYNLVETGECSALQLWRSLSTNPAICLHQTPATIIPNQPAELVLFNPQQVWQVDRYQLKSLSANTPYLGKQITGCVVKTWC
ncbi:MAG: dihydroorotase [Symploca sp. SIO2E9]|nr:dihydroorotase [Symploca sp. SIO2E9]